MRPGDIRDYFALRRHLVHPWRFLRLRHRPFGGPFCDLRLRDGGTVRIRDAPMDRHIFHRIFARDEYGLNAVAPGAFDTVVDVGAHAGFFAVRAAPLARRVLCYEPIPANFDLLRRNVARFPHVRAHPLAIAAKRGTVRMFLSDNPSSHSMFPAEPGREGIEVPCIPLSEVFAEHAIERCDLLKLDCEGAEYEILYAVPEELWRRIDRICMEVHPVAAGGKPWSAEGLVAHLGRVGHEARFHPSRRHPGKGHLFSVRKRA